MRRIGIRFLLWNKRLFKSPGFLVVLCLVPIMVGLLRIASSQEKGIVDISVYVENTEDTMAYRVVEELQNKFDVITFHVCESRAEAKENVENYISDIACLFEGDTYSKMSDAAHSILPDGVVTLLTRDEGLSVMFCREIICNVLYPHYSYLIYEDFMSQIPEMEDLATQELKKAYDDNRVSGNIFRMAYLDGTIMEKGDYLLAPIRGMLAIWLVLAGFAGSLYFVQDERKGSFKRLTFRKREWISYEFHAILLCDAGAVLLISIRILGLQTNWSREILSMVLFVICSIMFCNLIRLICGTPERMGCCITVVLLAMSVICPVFLSFPKVRMLSFLFPPTYYLNSIHNTSYLYYMLVYTVVTFILCRVVNHMRESIMKLN